MTDKGVVVATEGQVVDVAEDVDLIELFVSRQVAGNDDASDIFLGPAFIDNFEDF